MTLLTHHGDRDVTPGTIDLAVNVRPGTPPEWLRERLASVDVSRYPDTGPATDAVAARHRRRTDEVLVTAGAAEAFTLVARGLAPRRAVVIAPQFTEPERALRAAGHAADVVVLDEPFVLEPRLVPADADLVIVGNPTNPTSVLHPAEAIRALVRPGRVVVVDEAFADCVPGERHSLAGLRDLTGVIVVRSLTKTWGLAGLRVGYALGAPDLIARLAAAQPHWAVSSPAAEACVACCSPQALDEASGWARALSHDRAALAGALSGVPGTTVVPGAAASFVLARVPVVDVWQPLRLRGFAVRRGDTFRGLGRQWIRVAVRSPETSSALARALAESI
jgi:histidinol-phosphate aminotransferase